MVNNDAASVSVSPDEPGDGDAVAPVEEMGEGQVEAGEHRPKIVSFVSRSTRLKGRQQRAWDELAPLFVIAPPRLMSRTSIAPEAVLILVRCLVVRGGLWWRLGLGRVSVWFMPHSRRRILIFWR